jgi:hypothetical protein
MFDPQSQAAAGVTLITLAVGVFGPQVGPYIVILLASIAGSMWALSSAELATRMAGLWLLLRCVVTAIVLTSLIAQLLGPRIGLPVGEAYAVVAFVIGMMGNRWQKIIDSIQERIQGAISNSGSNKS